MRKILSAFIVVIYIFSNIFSIATALNTDERSSPWTREKASHLAHITLFNADKNSIDALFAAGSATAAVNMLFPDAVGPDRTAFNTTITNYTASGFNWGDANHTTRLYQLMYAADPYEAKRKLFSLFEDIFSVNRDADRDITYKDIYDLHSLLFNNMFGNYQVLVKKVMNNNGAPGDYAAGRFLDLFNQKDPTKPNENFARELLQLFLMGEYEPYRSKDNGDIRNYEESDVIALAKILTGLKSDSMTHIVSFDINNHYSGAPLKFLSGSVAVPPPYYNVASGTIDPMAILNPVSGNNGLTDNVIEYTFAQRGDQIALFLADRIARFYMSDKPTRAELDMIAQIIKNNNFDILPSIKTILALDMIYSNASMNNVRYKNPLELTIGSIRFLRNNTLTGITIDPNVYDTNLLRRLGWTPYFPGSIFGRDGFDNSLKWSSTSNQSAWMSASNYFTYRTSGTGAIDFLTMLGSQKMEITTGNISVMTHINNSYSGSLTIVSGTLNLGNPIPGVSIASMEASKVSLLSIDEGTPKYVYQLDPIVSILGGENLDLFTNTTEEWISDDIFLPQKEIEYIDTIETVITEKTEVSTPVLVDTGTTIGDTGSVLVDTGSILTGVEDKKIETTTITGEIIIPDVSVSIIESAIFSDVSTGVVANNSGEVTNTGVVIVPDSTSSGEVSTGVIDSGSILPIGVESGSLSSGSTDSGSVLSGSLGETKNEDVTPQKSEVVALASTVMISTGSVTLPLFKVVTGLGTITIFSGTYIGDTRTLLIHSGVIVLAGSGTEVLSGSTITFDTNSKLIADTISADAIIDTYETYIYGERRLQSDVKVLLKDFLTTNASGATIPVAPTNTTYFNKYVRGLLSILMSQPEYVLLSGYDLPATTNTTDQHFLDGITGKLFFVELYGGNDYMTSIIPKDEYSTYLDYRTNQSGSIAITGTGLVDIGDFYMNSALAYSSGGLPGFKDLYDQGYLKIFNRVGGYKHSNDHDAAAKQITSYDNTTALSAEGAFGHLVREEFESSHTISLGSKLPNIYRAGHFVNLGGSVILVNPLDSSGLLKAHMDTMQNITLSRSYPSNTRNLFRDAGRISEIAKMSVAQGGPSGANGDMNNVFRFAKVLMNNNVGRSFYMGGYGGYDTHGDQFNGLNRNLNFVSTAITNFFNEVKNTQDVTIVVFSEFGRTNKTNGDLGTDHGDGGGMYVITSNVALRTKLQAGTYGNMSIKNAKYNSLGIGVDYRSVYGSIYNSLYGLNESTYFGTPISLMNDISTTPNDISLLNYSYRASGQTPLLDIELTVSGNNFDPGKAGYTRLLAGTGLINQKITKLNEKIVPEGFRYNFQINPNNQPYYSIESFSNQYAINGFSGTFTGSTRPIVLGNTVRTVSQTGTSILPLFANTMVPSVLTGSGIILESTGGNILSIPNNNQIRIFFASGVTNVVSLTYLSGSTTWRGGFALAEQIDKDLFIPTSAIIAPDNISLQTSNITHLFKIGADLRGVGMNLNQSVGIEFSGLAASGSYRALSSQDGIIWNDVEAAGRLYTSSSTGSILVNTNHFSYFALLSMANVVVTPPSCTISINPNSVLNGSGTILTWSMLNSLTGTLNPGNTLLGTSGSMIITPPSNATTPYTLVVTNSAGTNSCTASVTASSVVVPPVTPPSCTISINPNSVLNGSGTILTWSMLNSLTGTLNPGNTLLGTSGSMIITPPSNATTPYTLVVTNSAGTNSCTASVTASSVVVPPVTPPSCTISINPNSVLNGSGTILTWSMLNSLTGTLNPGNTLLGTSGSMIITPPSNATTPYTLVVTNSAGTNSCTASVTASSVVVPPVTPPSCTISINPNSVLNGSGTILTWSMLNSLTGTLNPGNTLLGTSGSMIITPPSNATTPYTLVVTNSAGTNSCTASVTASSVVVPPPPGGGGGTVSGPGGGGGGGSSSVIRTIDSCLGGDFSGNNYDGICTPVTQIVRQPVIRNTVTDINVLHISNTLNRLISDLENGNGDTLSNNQEQRIYAISLGIWREISNRQDMNVNTAGEIINSLKDIRNSTNTVKTKKAIDIITGILEQFILLGGIETRENPSNDTINSDLISNNPIMDSPESIATTGTPKYVQAERSVTFRKTDYVGFYNVLDYLNRNTQVTLISEGMNGWTRVLYNGLEGYIKSAYLREGNDADILRSGGTVSDYHPQGYINVKQSAYVRSAPDLGARISSVVYRDNTVRILDSISGWYEILLNNGSHGYIRKELVNTMDTTL